MCQGPEPFFCPKIDTPKMRWH